jgi:hypothetical protein
MLRRDDVIIMPIIDVPWSSSQTITLALAISHGSQTTTAPVIFQHSTPVQNRTNTLKDFLVR